jgi:hypothetical protein
MITAGSVTSQETLRAGKTSSTTNNGWQRHGISSQTPATLEQQVQEIKYQTADYTVTNKNGFSQNHAGMKYGSG